MNVKAHMIDFPEEKIRDIVLENFEVIVNDSSASIRFHYSTKLDVLKQAKVLHEISGKLVESFEEEKA